MLEIANLNQRYARAADAADGSAFSRCFTEDGVFDRFGTAVIKRLPICKGPILQSNADTSSVMLLLNSAMTARGEGKVI